MFPNSCSRNDVVDLERARRATGWNRAAIANLNEQRSL